MTVKSTRLSLTLRSEHMIVVLLFGAFAISLAPIFVRISTLDPLVSAFYRLSLSLPVLMLVPFLGAGKENTPTRSLTNMPLRDVALMFLCGVMLAADLALWHISINMTTVANATLFNNCAPVVLLLLGWAFFGERISRDVFIALAVAATGMGLLMGGNFVLAPERLFGDAGAISTAFFYAIYLFMVKSLRARYDTFSIMVATSLASAICLLIVCMIQGWSMVPGSLEDWLVILGLAVSCHAIGQSLIAKALAYLPVTISSFCLLLQPVSAAILAWLLFQEALGPVQILGGVLVLGGIVLSNRAHVAQKGE